MIDVMDRAAWALRMLWLLLLTLLWRTNGLVATTTCNPTARRMPTFALHDAPIRWRRGGQTAPRRSPLRVSASMMSAPPADAPREHTGQPSSETPRPRESAFGMGGAVEQADKWRLERARLEVSAFCEAGRVGRVGGGWRGAGGDTGVSVRHTGQREHSSVTHPPTRPLLPSP